MSQDRTKRIAKNTLMLYFRMAFGMFVSLFTSRVVINALGVTDYGINSVVAGYVAFFSFLIFSMRTATQRYINVAMGKNDEKALNDVFSVSMVIHIGICVIVFLIGETVGLWFLYEKLVIPPDRLTAAFWVYQFTLISTATTVMSIPYNAEVVAHEKMGIYAYFSILEIVLKLAIVYMLVISPFDKLITYGFLYMCVSLLNRALFTIYCKRNFKECHLNLRYPRKLMKDMLTFAGWDLLGVIAWIFSEQGSTILINLFFGPAVNAAKAIAVQVKGAIQGFSSNFLMAMNPQITQSYAAGDTYYMHKLMYMGAKISFVLLYVMVLPLSIKAPLVLELWLKLVPDYTVIFIQIILVEMILDAMMTPLNTAALATGKIKFYGLLTSLISILGVPFCYVILKMGGSPESVFFALLGITLTKECIQFYKLRQLVAFSYSDYFLKVQLRALIVVAITLPSALLLTEAIPDTFLGLVVFCLIVCPLTLLLCFSLIFNKSEQDAMVHKYITPMFSKFKNRK